MGVLPQILKTSNLIRTSKLKNSNIRHHLFNNRYKSFEKYAIKFPYVRFPLYFNFIAEVLALREVKEETESGKYTAYFGSGNQRLTFTSQNELAAKNSYML